MDHYELAARTAVARWHGKEGQLAGAVRASKQLEMGMLTSFLNLWNLARSNPLDRRTELLAFLNTYAFPALKEVQQPSDDAYQIIEGLSERALAEKTTRGRPTSMLSKLALAVCPVVFIPYDSRVQEALRRAGKGIRAHCYRDYMRAVLSEKPDFDQELAQRDLSAQSLVAKDMSQELFEMRALDKWLMLQGGFSAATMQRELAGH